MSNIYFMEHQEIYKGYHIVCMFVTAHRCGYIGLPKGHKYAGKDYDAIDVSVHGGLTYSEHAPSFRLGGFEYYLGFDCGHWQDAPDIETMKRHGADEKYLSCWSAFPGDVVRTQQYVIEECKSVVNQIIDMFAKEKLK